jgi:parallel beta-helix repeat protein
MNSRQPPDPALRSYFFGKGYRDLWATIADSWRRNMASARGFFGNASGAGDPEGIFQTFVMLIAGVSTVVFGTVFFVIASIAHVVLLLAFFVLVYIGFTVLWVIERAVLAIRSFFLVCPHCHVRQTLPEYLCDGCGKVHARLVPNSYGILFHTCVCGRRLPATLFLNRGRLQARCPACHESVAREHVESVRLFVPVMGGPSAGKSAFLFSAVRQLIEREASVLGFDAEPFDKRSRNTYQAVLRLLKSGRPPDKTRDPIPRAFNLALRRGGRLSYLLYMYDPAGEAYQDTEALGEHAFHEYLSGMVFILDPFAIPAVRSSYLDGTEQEWQLKPSELPIEDAVDRLLLTLEESFGLSKRGRVHQPLAVVLSKADAFDLWDLVGESAVDRAIAASSGGPAANRDAVRNEVIKRQLANWGQQGFVKRIESRFANVRFFSCSALGRMPDGGSADFAATGVLTPLLWLIDQAEGGGLLLDRSRGRRVPVPRLLRRSRRARWLTAAAVVAVVLLGALSVSGALQKAYSALAVSVAKVLQAPNPINTNRGDNAGPSKPSGTPDRSTGTDSSSARNEAHGGSPSPAPAHTIWSGLVEVAAGSFQVDSPVYVEGTATVRGRGENTSTLAFTGPGTFVSVMPGAQLRVEGVTLARTGGGPGDVIAVESGSVSVDSSRITGGRYGDGFEGAGVWVAGSSVAVLERATLEANGAGLFATGDTNIRLTSTRVQSNERFGLFFDGSSGTVRNASVLGNGAEGIVLTGNSEMQISDSTITGNAARGISYLQWSGGTAVNNLVSGNGFGDASRTDYWQGIAVQDNASPVLDGNTVRENAGIGIQFRNNARGTVESNVVASNGHNVARYGPPDASVGGIVIGVRGSDHAPSPIVEATNTLLDNHGGGLVDYRSAGGVDGVQNARGVTVAAALGTGAALQEDFESYGVGQFPSPVWVPNANAASDVGRNLVILDPEDSSNQVLQLYGSHPGNWSALAYRACTFPEVFDVRLRVYMHDYFVDSVGQGAVVQMRQGTSWRNPGRGLLHFAANGDVRLGSEVLGSFEYGRWHDVSLRYARSGAQVMLDAWLDGLQLGPTTVSVNDLSQEEAFDHIGFDIRGGVLFDDLSVGCLGD